MPPMISCLAYGIYNWPGVPNEFYYVNEIGIILGPLLTYVPGMSNVLYCVHGHHKSSSGTTMFYIINMVCSQD